MSKAKFLALCKGMGEGWSFKAKRYRDRKFWVNLICRDSSGRERDEYLYSTTSLSKAVDAENRFNMWLFQEGLHQDCRPSAPAPAVPDGVMPGGLVYSTATPEFESNDRDKVAGYHCFISGQTRRVESQEQAYADAQAVINACRAAMPASAPGIVLDISDADMADYIEVIKTEKPRGIIVRKATVPALSTAAREYIMAVLKDAAEGARANDPDVGIFPNDKLASEVDSLISAVEDAPDVYQREPSDPNGAAR